MPSAIRSVLEGVTRGRPLEPVALVRTLRSVHRLRAADNSLLAEVCDDRVTTQSPPDGSGAPPVLAGVGGGARRRRHGASSLPWPRA